MSNGYQKLRYSAVNIITRIEKDAAYVDRLLNDYFNSTEGLSVKEKNWVTLTVKGTLQWRDRIDVIISRCLISNKKKLPGFIESILRVAVYQLLFMNTVDASTVVYESVELAKKKSPVFKGLVNAVLRKVDLNSLNQILPEDINNPERIAVEFSHPLWLVQRLLKQYEPENVRSYCQYNNEVWPVALHANILKTDASELQKILLNEGVKTRQGNSLNSILVVEGNRSNQPLHETLSFQKGLFYILDESSAMPAYALNPLPGETVLDLCSAPGGKTMTMALLMKNTGVIHAVDKNQKRLELVKDNCQRLELKIVETICQDGEKFISDILYDKILVDVPCSGTGVLGRKADLRWQRGEDDLLSLNDVQLSLLSNAAKYIKKNGSIVYSTCSIDKSENEEILDKFLNQNNDFSLLKIEEQSFIRNNPLTILPHIQKMGGMFIAVLYRR